jgi:hypothetical protein
MLRQTNHSSFESWEALHFPTLDPTLSVHFQSRVGVEEKAEEGHSPWVVIQTRAGECSEVQRPAILNSAANSECLNLSSFCILISFQRSLRLSQSWRRRK